jgi:hypothetical protein
VAHITVLHPFFEEPCGERTFAGAGCTGEEYGSFLEIVTVERSTEGGTIGRDKHGSTFVQQ